VYNWAKVRHVRYFQCTFGWKFLIEISFGGIVFARDDLQLRGSSIRDKLIQAGFQFETGQKETLATHDIETKASTGDCHHQASHIADMSHRLCSHKGQNYVIILLALIMIHCRDRTWTNPREWRPVPTSLSQNIIQQILLSIVRRENWNLKWKWNGLKNGHQVSYKNYHREINTTSWPIVNSCQNLDVYLPVLMGIQWEPYTGTRPQHIQLHQRSGKNRRLGCFLHDPT
jgi:hypothetical protein